MGLKYELRNQLLEEIDSITDISRLAKILTLDQSDSWYDPCGKGGNELNTHFTRLSQKCVRRIHELIGMGKLK